MVYCIWGIVVILELLGVECGGDKVKEELEEKNYIINFSNYRGL